MENKKQQDKKVGKKEETKSKIVQEKLPEVKPGLLQSFL